MFQRLLTSSGRKFLATLIIGCGVTLSGCGGDDDDMDGGDETPAVPLDFVSQSQTPLAVVATRSFGFESGAISIFDTDGSGQNAQQLNASGSDIRVRSFGNNFYVLAGFGVSSLTRYNLSAADTATLQVSLNTPDVEEDANPHDMVFVSEEKAYVLRYGTGEIWIVNPSATSDADFLLGTIDLSGYDADGVPEMHRGMIIGDRLFVFMQRLELFAPTQSAYVAVIDTATDTEIDTGTGGDFLGVELPIRNPAEIALDPATGDIFIAASGRFGFEGFSDPEYTGGVAVLNPDDYSTMQIADDSAEVGQFVNVQVMDVDTAYTIVYRSSTDNALVEIDPITGELGDVVAELNNVDLEGMATGPNGNLWVGVADQENPRLVVINPADNSVVREVPMVFNTLNIVFASN